jgi:hypothetical protein
MYYFTYFRFIFHLHLRNHGIVSDAGDGGEREKFTLEGWQLFAFFSPRKDKYIAHIVLKRKVSLKK